MWTWTKPSESNQRKGQRVFRRPASNCQMIFPVVASRTGGRVAIRQSGRKWPDDLTLGVRGHRWVPFTSAGPLHPSPEISHLKQKEEGLSNLSPIDHSSWRGHKSTLRPPQMATSKLCQLDNTNRIQAEERNKAPELALVWKGIRRCQSCAFAASWFGVFCPAVAPIVCQMCVHPLSSSPHPLPDSHPPACDLRQARGRILGNFSLTSYTVDRGAFLRWGKVTAPTLQGRASQSSGSADWKSLMNSH